MFNVCRDAFYTNTCFLLFIYEYGVEIYIQFIKQIKRIELTLIGFGIDKSHRKRHNLHAFDYIRIRMLCWLMQIATATHFNREAKHSFR